MLLTIDKLNINFNEDIDDMKRKLQELEKLEKAITDSAHYKLLAGKTQMLGKDKGVTKKERSRLMHSNKIANEIVEKITDEIYKKILAMNPDLATSEYKEIYELNKKIDILRGIIMAKAHDLGHVAFGHEGERAIAKFVEEINKDQEEIDAWLEEHHTYFGEDYELAQGHDYSTKSFSFEHNELSAIILNQIMEKENINISAEDKRKLTLGVLGHSTSRTDIKLLENDIVAQIVRIADKIEYMNYDWDEISSLINISQNINCKNEVISYLSKDIAERIDITNKEVIEEVFKYGSVHEKRPSMIKLKEMRKMYHNIIYYYDAIGLNKTLNELTDISTDEELLELYYEKNPVVEHLYSADFVKNTLVKLKKLSILQEFMEYSDNQRILDRLYSKNKKLGKIYPREFIEGLVRDTKESLTPTKKEEIDNFKRSGDISNLVSTLMEEINKQYRTNRDKYKNIVPVLKNINVKYCEVYNEIFDNKIFFKSVMQHENSERIHFIYKKILNYYYNNPEKIPNSVSDKVNPIDIAKSKTFSYTLNSNYTKLQRVLEYISLFDDKSLMDKYKELVQERCDKGPGFGIEPVKLSEIKSYIKRKETSSDGKVKWKGEFVAAAIKDANRQDNSTHNEEESIKRYIEKCEYFFKERLTPEGKKTMSKSYEKRFEEFEDDLKLWRKIEDADLKYGRILPEKIIPNKKVQEEISIEEKNKEGHTHVD